MSLTWTTYTATIEISDRLIGGIPITNEGDRPDAFKGWLRGQQLDNTDVESLADTLTDVPDMPTGDGEEVLGTSFRADDDGLYIEARQIKAMLREAAQRLGIIKRVRGSRQVVQHDLHIRGTDGSQKIHLGRTQPDGTDTRPISVMTPQGPRTSIKRFDYVVAPTLVFEIRLLDGGVGAGLIGEEELRDMLELGGMLGLGADRSQGEGTFILVSLEELVLAGLSMGGDE